MPNINPRVQRALQDARDAQTSAAQRTFASEADLAKKRAEREAQRRRTLREKLPEIIATSHQLGELATTPTTVIGQKVFVPHGIIRRITQFETVLSGWALATWLVDSNPRAPQAGPDPDTSWLPPATGDRFSSRIVRRSLIIGSLTERSLDGRKVVERQEAPGLYLVETTDDWSYPSHRRTDYQAAGLPLPARYDIVGRDGSQLGRGHGNPMEVTANTPVELFGDLGAEQVEQAFLGLIAVENLQLPLPTRRPPSHRA